MSPESKTFQLHLARGKGWLCRAKWQPPLWVSSLCHSPHHTLLSQATLMAFMSFTILLPINTHTYTHTHTHTHTHTQARGCPGPTESPGGLEPSHRLCPLPRRSELEVVGFAFSSCGFSLLKEQTEPAPCFPDQFAPTSGNHPPFPPCSHSFIP